MPFEQISEKQRKEYLLIMEDKRIRFAEELEKMGFAPERMIFFSNDDGGFTALSRLGKKYAVIHGPIFASDEDFSLHILDEMNVEREDVQIKGTGLNGAFGFGTKGARGFNLHITLPEGDVATLAVVAGRASWMETNLKKNPLLKTKRRRGNANIVWDMLPIDPGSLSKVESLLAEYYFAE